MAPSLLPHHRRTGWGPSLILATALAAVPGAALAASPVHENFSDAQDDVEVCGLIVDMTSRGQWTNTSFVDEDGRLVLFRGTYSAEVTYAADDGRAIMVRDANQLTSTDGVIDETDGTITFTETLRGVPNLVTWQHGPVLLREAGISTIAFTIDLATGEFLGYDVLVDRGPHPNLESGFALFCEVFVAALG